MKTKIQKHKAMRSLAITSVIICSSVLFEGCASAPPEPDVPPPAAKSGPSFEETRDWIIATMKQHGGYDVSGRSLFKNVSINNLGRLIFDECCYSDDDYSTPYVIRRRTIPLGAVTDIKADFTTNRGGSGSIDIKTGNIAAIDYEEYSASGDNSLSHDNKTSFSIENYPHAVSGQFIPENDWEITKRLVTALQHMVDICKDTYQAPTQTAQPF